MAVQISDGTGDGLVAQVNDQNQVMSYSETIQEEVYENIDGNAYNINTGLVSLTNATDTPLLYFKNTETRDFILQAVAIGMFDSTNGSATADVYATFIRNPTVGTIITSTPTDVAINSNRNYGSNKTLSCLAYVGATGDTMTDGDDHILVRLSDAQRAFITINEVMPEGSSFGVKIKPPTSNTGMNCYVALIGYRRTEST